MTNLQKPTADTKIIRFSTMFWCLTTRIYFFSPSAPWLSTTKSGFCFSKALQFGRSIGHQTKGLRIQGLKRCHKKRLFCYDIRCDIGISNITWVCWTCAIENFLCTDLFVVIFTACHTPLWDCHGRRRSVPPTCALVRTAKAKNSTSLGSCSCNLAQLWQTKSTGWG